MTGPLSIVVKAEHHQINTNKSARGFDATTSLKEKIITELLGTLSKVGGVEIGPSIEILAHRSFGRIADILEPSESGNPVRRSVAVTSEVLKLERQKLINEVVTQERIEELEATRDRISEIERELAELAIGLSIGEPPLLQSSPLHEQECTSTEVESNSIAVYLNSSRFGYSAFLFGDADGHMRCFKAFSTFEPSRTYDIRAFRDLSESGFAGQLSSFRDALVASSDRAGASSHEKFSTSINLLDQTTLISTLNTYLTCNFDSTSTRIKLVTGACWSLSFPDNILIKASDNSQKIQPFFERWSATIGTDPFSLTIGSVEASKRRRGVLIVGVPIDNNLLATIRKYCDFHSLDLVLGGEANVKNTSEQFSKSELVILIAHASSGQSRYDFPRIQLFDGYLDAGDFVEGMELTGCSVVLLACESGLKTPGSDLQVFSSIPETFLLAGARQVVATNWPIYTNIVQGLFDYMHDLDPWDIVSLEAAIRGYQNSLRKGEVDLQNVPMHGLYALSRAERNDNMLSEDQSFDQEDPIFDGRSTMNWAVFSVFKN